MEIFVKRVQDTQACTTFQCGKSFWVLEVTGKTKKEVPGAFPLVDQVGTCSLSLKDAYGRYAAKNMLQRHPHLRCEVFGTVKVFTVLALDESGAVVSYMAGKPGRSQIITSDVMNDASDCPNAALTSSILGMLPIKASLQKIRKKAKVSKSQSSHDQNESSVEQPLVVTPTSGDPPILHNVDHDSIGIDLDSNDQVKPIYSAKLVDSVIAQVIRNLRDEQSIVSSELQTLAQLVVKRCTNENGVSSLECHNVVLRRFTAEYVYLAKQRKDASKLEVGRNPRAVTKKAKTVAQIISQLGSQKISVLQALAKQEGFSIFLTSSLILQDYEIIALRDYIGTSMRGVVRMSHFMKAKELPMLFPPNFVRLVAKYEAKGGPSFMTAQVPLYTNKKEDKKQFCTFWWDRDPHRVAEDILSRSILDSSFEESITFSSVDKKFILVFGGDKGGEMFSMLIRTANRRDGNSSRHSQVLAQYEDGAECYDNLRQTVYSDTYPVRSFVQLLLDNQLVALAFKVKNGQSTIDCCSSLVQVTDLGKKASFIPNNVKFELLSKNNTTQYVIPEIDCRQLRKLIEVPIDVGDGHLHLLLRLVEASATELSDSGIDGDTENGTRYFSGYIVIYETKVVESFRWARNRILRVPLEASVSLEQYQTIGFPSNDTKQSLIVSGICSAASSCPCLVCVARSSEFTERLPSWQSEYKDESTDDITVQQQQYGPDAPLRTGPMGYRQCYERYIGETGEGQFAKTYDARMKDKRASGSVVFAPLADVPHEKESMSPMHASQGIFTHFSDCLRGKLHAIDKDGQWMVHVHTVLTAAKQYLAGHQDDSWRINHMISQDYDKKRAVLAKKKDTATDLNSILKLSDEIANVKDVKQEHAKTSGYDQKNLLQAGAKETQQSIEKYLKSKKPKGPAEYTFNRSIELHANIRFQAQHSGFELTNKDGIKVLAVWDKVCKSTAMSYPHHLDTIGKQICELMNDSKKIARPLLQLSKLLKSQDKFTDQHIRKLKFVVAQLSKEWRKVLSGKKVFLKLHHVECHILSFAILYRMVGRLSEEGFEACHPVMNAVQRVLKSIVSTQQRVATFGRRLNVRSDDKVQSVISDVNKKFTGPKRGTYNKTTINLRVSEELEFMECGTCTPSSEFPGFSVLSVGGIIPNEWRDVYLMSAHGHVPSYWSSSFQLDPELGSSQKQHSKFFRSN